MTYLEQNRAAVRSSLASHPRLECVAPGGGPVIFPRLRGVDDAEPFVDRLFAEHQTAVVPGRFFEAPAHFRIACGGRPETVAGGLARIGKALAEH